MEHVLLQRRRYGAGFPLLCTAMILAVAEVPIFHTVHFRYVGFSRRVNETQNKTSAWRAHDSPIKLALHRNECLRLDVRFDDERVLFLVISVVHLVTNLHIVRIVHNVLDHVLQHRVPGEDGIDFGVTVLGLQLSDQVP